MQYLVKNALVVHPGSTLHDSLAVEDHPLIRLHGFDRIATNLGERELRRRQFYDSGKLRPCKYREALARPATRTTSCSSSLKAGNQTEQ